MASAVSNCRTAAKGCCGALQMVMAGSRPPPLPEPTTVVGLTFPWASFSCFSAVACLTFASLTILWASWKRQHLKGWRPSVSAFVFKAHFSRHLWPEQRHPAEAYPGTTRSMSSIGREVIRRRTRHSPLSIYWPLWQPRWVQPTQTPASGLRPINREWLQAKPAKRVWPGVCNPQLRHTCVSLAVEK